MISSFFFINNAYSQVTSNLTEVKVGSIDFIYESYKSITEGITLGSESNPYTILRFSFDDQRAAPAVPGWRLVAVADDELAENFGTVISPVQLSDIEIYVSSGDNYIPGAWSAPVALNIGDNVIATDSKNVADTMFFIYYKCNALTYKTPNIYSGFLNFVLEPLTMP